MAKENVKHETNVVEVKSSRFSHEVMNALHQGSASLVMIAQTPVVLPIKFKAGDTLTSAQASALQAAFVRQYRNNTEAKVKAKGAMTSEAIANGFASYEPSVGDDSLLSQAAGRLIDAMASEQGKSPAVGDVREALIAKAIASTKARERLWTFVETLIAEASVAKVKGEKKNATTASDLDL